MHRSGFWLDAAGVSSLVLVWLVSMVFLPALPDRIVVHFDASGRPDGFGPAAMAWSLPVVSSVLFVLLSVVGRNPSRFNYPVTITSENADYQYALASDFIRISKMILQGVFLALLWVTIESSDGSAPGWAVWLLPMCITAVLLPLFIYVWRASRC